MNQLASIMWRLVAWDGEGRKTGVKKSLYLFTGGWTPSLLSVSSRSYRHRGVFAWLVDGLKKLFIFFKFLFYFFFWRGGWKSFLSNWCSFSCSRQRSACSGLAKHPQLSTAHLFLWNPGEYPSAFSSQWQADLHFHLRFTCGLASTRESTFSSHKSPSWSSILAVAQQNSISLWLPSSFLQAPDCPHPSPCTPFLLRDSLSLSTTSFSDISLPLFISSGKTNKQTKHS